MCKNYSARPLFANEHVAMFENISLSILFMGFTAALLLTASPTLAAPPPLGPAATLQKSNTPSFSIEVLRRFVEGFAQQVVINTNTSLAAAGKSARVSRGPVVAWSPHRIATTFVDQPNQYIVRAPFNIRIDVDIPWVANRVIYIPLDIEVSCEGWSRSTGQLRFVAVPGPASIEGGSIFEDIIGVRDVITSRVRSGFTPPSSSELPFSGECSTIGVSNEPSFEAIIWSPRPSIRHLFSKQRIEVTPLTLSRIPAQTIDGQPIGNTVETISLLTYANFHACETLPFNLRVNEQIALNLPSILLDGEPTSSLVVIGNVRDALLRTISTSFDVSTQSIDYSPGMHTLQLSTETWQNPRPPLRKPLKVNIPTYVLTYYVSYTPPFLDTISVGSSLVRAGRFGSGVLTP